VLVDVTHPVHVHLFKHLVTELQSAAHDVLVVACDKDVALELLRRYDIEHVCTGSYGRSPFRKMVGVPRMDWELLTLARRFRPDALVAEAPVRASHVGFVLGKPCIGLDDTEHAKLQRALWLPFVTKVLTPSCYGLDLGPKQLRYQGYKELAYLHPSRFSPDSSVLAAEGLCEGELFAVVRFVSWKAAHDIGQGGFSREGRLRLVSELARYGRVLVSAEDGSDPELAEYMFRAPPHLMHHFLYYAAVCVTEGATIASECAVLGTPAVYMNSLALGYLNEQEQRYGLVFNFHKQVQEDVAIDTALRIVSETWTPRAEWRLKAERLEREHIDVTGFLLTALKDTLSGDGSPSRASV
jgi:hypothetical protein